MKQEKLTFEQLCLQKGFDTYCLTKQAEKFLNVNVVREVSSSNTDFPEWIQERRNAPFPHKYIVWFVILENGYAVGWNENPSKGWTYPVVKYKGKI